MGDMRNKIIHDYFGVDFDIIWDLLKTGIPQLKIEVGIILKEKQ